jgi:hypothetical protein
VLESTPLPCLRRADADITNKLSPEMVGALLD